MRVLLSTAVSLVVAVLIGIAAAAGLAAFRGGQFSHELRISLWVVGVVTLLLAVFSFSPSTRRAPDELMHVMIGRRFAVSHPDEGGAGLGLTAILALAAFAMFGIAFLVG